MEKIEKGIYDGYLWYSNASKPEEWIAKETDEIILNEDKIPFVIEGQLYDKNTNASYSIRFVDGKYIVVKTVISPDDVKNGDIKYFIPHRMNTGRLVFIQYWDEVDDTDGLCEGMKTQVPGKLVFYGFEKKEDKQ